jgi:predicted dehydrogenase
MLKKEDLDVAAIFLPHADCPEAAVKCARHGLHLMVEKPAASTSAGVRRIIAAAKRAGVKFTTGYCWRLHPVAREFKRLIDEGAIGEPIGAEGRCAAGRLERYLAGHAGWMLERERKGADVILFSAFPPNENWHYGTHRMGEFATATRQAATEEPKTVLTKYLWS